MGKSPCCDSTTEIKRGAWTPAEDQKLLDYIQKHGHGSWRSLPDRAGLQRCGKSCRLRWINYLRPDIKRGNFSLHEQNTIIQLHALLGNRWSAIASYLPTRTDNEIKNYWNTHIKKRLARMGIDPTTHRPMAAAQGVSGNGGADPKRVSNLTHMAQWESARLEAEARLAKESSKMRQNNHHQPAGLLPTAPTRPPLPTRRINKTASRLGATRCLDILKAWERVQLKSSMVLIEDCNESGDQGSSNELHSPLQNVRAAASLHCDQENEGLFSRWEDMEIVESGEAWNIAGDEELMIKGLSNLVFDNSETDDRLLDQCYSNTDNEENKCGNNNNDVNNNYWDDMLIECGL